MYVTLDQLARRLESHIDGRIEHVQTQLQSHIDVRMDMIDMRMGTIGAAIAARIARSLGLSPDADLVTLRESIRRQTY